MHGKVTGCRYSQRGQTYNVMFRNGLYVRDSESDDLRELDIKRYYKLDYDHKGNTMLPDFNEVIQ